MQLVETTRRLADGVDELRFSPPITHVYNPLRYASGPHELYLSRWGNPPREILMIGMNPGPWGMAQTGVPFGEVDLVRDWLGIEGPVGKPRNEHPKRPVDGFQCGRSEVSGARLWGWAKERFQTPGAFFSRFFVYNYCPLALFEESGRNRTPDRLPLGERKPLFEKCDLALRRVAEYFESSVVVGIGKFAERRSREALSGLAVRITSILHPSPANPAANRGWAEAAERQLADAGLEF